MDKSTRLLSPEKIPVLENLLTPVDKNQFQKGIVGFEHGIELLEELAVGVGLIQVFGQIVDDGRIVFVHQHHHFPFLGGKLNDLFKAAADSTFHSGEIVLALQFVEHIMQGRFEACLHETDPGQGTAQGGIFFVPVPFICYPQPLEQFAAPAVELVQHSDRDRFTKAAGAGKEKVLARGGQCMYIASFIHILVAILYDAAEVL